MNYTKQTINKYSILIFSELCCKMFKSLFILYSRPQLCTLEKGNSTPMIIEVERDPGYSNNVFVHKQFQIDRL